MHTSLHFPADTARSYRSIEQDAARTRQRLGFGPTERLSAMECLRRLSSLQLAAVGETFSVGYGVRELALGVEGATYFDQELRRFQIDLSVDTYHRLADLAWEDVRARFAFGHELGHATLHCEELVRISRVPRLKLEAFTRSMFPQVSACEDVEWQANAFSSSFLMPALTLERLSAAGRLDEEEVCREFGVSRKAAEIRIGVFRARRQELVGSSVEFGLQITRGRLLGGGPGQSASAMRRPARPGL
jgi:hypothetical protein